MASRRRRPAKIAHGKICRTGIGSAPANEGTAISVIGRSPGVARPMTLGEIREGLTPVRQKVGTVTVARPCRTHTGFQPVAVAAYRATTRVVNGALAFGS